MIQVMFYIFSVMSADAMQGLGDGGLGLEGGGLNDDAEEEPWEKEVDDLVAWTSKLDSDML